MSLYQELLECGHGPIVDMAMKCEAVFSSHGRALVSVSGGADSDVMLDLCERVRREQPIEIVYAWFDTGMEYRATKEHIRYLEGRYGIEVERHRAEKTIPASCHDHGQPFLSKYVSEMCEKLQSIGFGWEDEPYEALLERYGAQTSALKWWCNRWTKTEEAGWFDIGRVRWLKEFMVEHPPEFRISARCCRYAKKQVGRRLERERAVDLSVIGVRRAEGGVRASHDRCFDSGGHGIDTYRPLFWLSDADRAWYARRFGVTHSDCYEVWGFRRTGCAGCPYGRDKLSELEVIERYEPNMAKACRKVFADSYEYTRQFHEFRRRMKDAESGQMRLEFEL